MTAQIADTVALKDRRFSIVGVKGESLFDPATCGLKPVARCTGCWRGYVCHYRIEDDRLILDALGVWLDRGAHPDGSVRSDVAPDIDGVSAVARTINIPGRGIVRTGEFIYEHIGRKIEFTGGLLLGDGFIEDLYVHMGFHPAWKFGTVVELALDRGRLVEQRDVSGKIRQVRRRMMREPLHPRHGASHQEIESWIESTFRLDYDW